MKHLYRKGKRITRTTLVDDEIHSEVEDFKSINAAKRASRADQKAGWVWKVA